MTLQRGAILCDFDGCWSAMVVSSAIEVLIPPVSDVIQHRAWVSGWTTDDQARDLCSRHPADVLAMEEAVEGTDGA